MQRKEKDMRRKKGNNGVFILFVLIAVIVAVVLMFVLPETVNQWKQLIFFGTVIVITAVEIAIYKRKRN